MTARPIGNAAIGVSPPRAPPAMVQLQVLRSTGQRGHGQGHRSGSAKGCNWQAQPWGLCSRYHPSALSHAGPHPCIQPTGCCCLLAVGRAHVIFWQNHHSIYTYMYTVHGMGLTYVNMCASPTHHDEVEVAPSHKVGREEGPHQPPAPTRWRRSKRGVERAVGASGMNCFGAASQAMYSRKAWSPICPFASGVGLCKRLNTVCAPGF